MQHRNFYNSKTMAIFSLNDVDNVKEKNKNKTWNFGIVPS
jgi:hypothetical protein